MGQKCEKLLTSSSSSLFKKQNIFESSYESNCRVFDQLSKDKKYKNRWVLIVDGQLIGDFKSNDKLVEYIQENRLDYLDGRNVLIDKIRIK